MDCSSAPGIFGSVLRVISKGGFQLEQAHDTRRAEVHFPSDVLRTTGCAPAALVTIQRGGAGPLSDAAGQGRGERKLILGFDIGSTGSKAVALDVETEEMTWEGYTQTNGNPVGAAQMLMQQFVESPARRHPVLAIGATGSGREIVGSLMATCYGVDAVYILNEIAAHAAGACRTGRGDSRDGENAHRMPRGELALAPAGMKR